MACISLKDTFMSGLMEGLSIAILARHGKCDIFPLKFHFLNPSIRVFFNSCRRLPETKLHSSLFLHWSGSKFLVVMAACTPSIHVFLGRPLFLLSRGIHSKINFGILSSGIILMWPYHCTIFKYRFFFWRRKCHSQVCSWMYVLCSTLYHYHRLLFVIF